MIMTVQNLEIEGPYSRGKWRISLCDRVSPYMSNTNMCRYSAGQETDHQQERELFTWVNFNSPFALKMFLVAQAIRYILAHCAAPPSQSLSNSTLPETQNTELLSYISYVRPLDIKSWVTVSLTCSKEHLYTNPFSAEMGFVEGQWQNKNKP